MSVKAQVLFATDKQDEGLEMMDQILDEPTAAINNYYGYAMQLIGLDKDEKALEVMEKAYKKWETDPSAQHGMAKAHSALGNFKKALKYEKLCLANPALPANNKPVLEGYVKKLEAGTDIN